MTKPCYYSTREIVKIRTEKRSLVDRVNTTKGQSAGVVSKCICACVVAMAHFFFFVRLAQRTKHEAEVPFIF